MAPPISGGAIGGHETAPPEKLLKGAAYPLEPRFLRGRGGLTVTPLKTRTKPPRGRLHLRLAAREVAEIQQATKTFGATTPAALFLQLIRQQHQTETLAIQVEHQLQGVVELAVAQLGDRLAADLSVISTALSSLGTAVDERPTKAQLSAFIDFVRGKPPGAGASFSTATGMPSPSAKVAP